jgi:hypothetical protein
MEQLRRTVLGRRKSLDAQARIRIGLDLVALAAHRGRHGQVQDAKRLRHSRLPDAGRYPDELHGRAL